MYPETHGAVFFLTVENPVLKNRLYTLFILVCGNIGLDLKPYLHSEKVTLFKCYLNSHSRTA